MMIMMVQQGMCGENQRTCGFNQTILGNLATNMEGCETKHVDIDLIE
jgi:hypothetical protein